MTVTRKPPFRFICKRLKELDDWPLAEDERYRCTGRCTRPIRAAQFRRGDEYVILHPSTKYRGNWQVSWFDNRGPIYDQEVTSCDAGLKAIIDDWPTVRIDEKGRIRPSFIVEDWADR